jgi:hypothetical protein
MTGSQRVKVTQTQEANMTRFYRIAVLALGLTTACVPTWAETGNVTRGERMYRACLPATRSSPIAT